MMRKFRGFNIKKRVFNFFRRKRPVWGYRRIGRPSICKAKTISRIFSCLSTKAKSLCSLKPSLSTSRGYVPLGQDPIQEKPVSVPKGHLAVYVGQKDGDFHRFFVPVIYFNHPLFGGLLREAEREYGFDHPGGITIPCRISEFESVQTQIAAGCRSRKPPTRKGQY